MLKVIALSGLLVFGSALAFADSYSGKLVDANCAAQQSNATCTPTASTTSFALQSSAGKTMKLDAEGNRKAADALKANNSNADRSKEPNAQDSRIMVKVEGTLNGDELKVETIQIQ